METRRYTLKKRADQQQETRTRIVEAASALHEELGPRATTISAVAKRAGVQRLTVYRHFPDEAALFQACSAHWEEIYPPPDIQAWSAASAAQDAPTATASALAALYAYYRRTQGMWSVVYKDLEAVPPLQKAMRGFEDYLEAHRSELLARWYPGRVGRSRRAASVRAVLGHALRFATWQSLAKEGVEDEEMAQLVVEWIASLQSKRRVARRAGRLPG